MEEGSTTTKLVSSYGGATTPTSTPPEESGWTQYLDDFMTSDDGGSFSSLATDASSRLLPRKPGDFDGFEVERTEDRHFLHGKRKKEIRSMHRVERDRPDDPLEDTACSSAVANTKVGNAAGNDAEACGGYSPLSDKIDRSKVYGVAATICSSRLRRNVVAGGVEKG